jgi:hypothetical protein
MKPLDTHYQPRSEKYKSSFSLMPSSVVPVNSVSSKPIVDIQYINAEEFDARSTLKPKKPNTNIMPDNYSLARTKKYKKPPSLFSLSYIGMGLTTIGALDFVTSKQYLAGAILFGSGLLAYGIGQNLENRR